MPLQAHVSQGVFQAEDRHSLAFSSPFGSAFLPLLWVIFLQNSGI